MQMAIEVIADLALRFCDEAETPLVTDYATERTARERAGVPDRAQLAGFFTQLIQALLTPGKVVEFFIGGLLHFRLDFAGARDDRVTLVEPLCGNLSCVVYAHQSRGMRSLSGVEAAFIYICCRIRPRRQSCGSSNRPKRIAYAGKYSVQGGYFSRLHQRDYTNDNARR